jgi:hypothetical protein
MCVRVFICVSVRTSISIYDCNMFLKKKSPGQLTQHVVHHRVRAKTRTRWLSKTCTIFPGTSFLKGWRHD